MAKTKQSQKLNRSIAKWEKGISGELVLPAGTRFAKLAMGCMVSRPGLPDLLIDFGDHWVREVHTDDLVEMLSGKIGAEYQRRTRAAVIEDAEMQETEARISTRLDHQPASR